jgi:predicted lipid-binding transport protein (Tim44 family)
MTTEPTPATPPPAFRWGPFIGGLACSLGLGMIFNLIAGLIGLSIGIRVLGAVIGFIPGVVFIVLSFPAKHSFRQGLLVGGCIVALIGGVCGGLIVGNSYH